MPLNASIRVNCQFTSTFTPTDFRRLDEWYAQERSRQRRQQGAEAMPTSTVPSKGARSRRAFLKHTLAAGAAGASLSVVGADQVLARRSDDSDESQGTLTKGDAALL